MNTYRVRSGDRRAKTGSRAEVVPPVPAPTSRTRSGALPLASASSPAAANPLRRSRAGTLWVGVVVFAGVLVLLLIFILQNTQPVEVSYFGFAGTVPLAVAMLLAAIAGVLLAATAGALRIFQLRRRVPRSARHR